MFEYFKEITTGHILQCRRCLCCIQYGATGAFSCVCGYSVRVSLHTFPLMTFTIYHSYGVCVCVCTCVDQQEFYLLPQVLQEPPLVLHLW